MPRPPAVSSDTLVDAAICARSASTIERRYSLDQLQRLSEAGARDGSEIDVSLEFSLFDGQPAVEGTLSGTIVVTCQRCMQALPVALDERFQLLIVDEERVDEPGGYEPIVGDASRFDVRWLAEDQALLALPLVALHEPGVCEEAEASAPDSGDGAASQKPFQNLRDMLRQR
jgi:uncharacterized protein